MISVLASVSLPLQVFGRQLPAQKGPRRASRGDLRPQPPDPEGGARSQEVSRPPRVRQGHQEEACWPPRSGSGSGSVALDDPGAEDQVLRRPTARRLPHYEEEKLPRGSVGKEPIVALKLSDN